LRGSKKWKLPVPEIFLDFVIERNREMSKVKYVTDLDGYEGPIELVSPYHYYMHTYWTLRDRWRRLLYAWIRRKPCDASATVVPERTVAGVPTSLYLTIAIGRTPLPEGGRIAVYFPLGFGGLAKYNSLMCFQGPDGQTGYGSRIRARASRPDVKLTTLVHSTGSVFTCVEVIVEEGRLEEGDKVEITIGDPSCKPPVVGEKAKSYPFRVAIDYQGDDTFRPLLPNPVVTNVGSRAQYLRCFAPATPKIGETFSLRVVASDLMNHNPSYFYRGRVVLQTTTGKIEGPGEIEIPEDRHGTVEIDGIAVLNKGVTRIQVMDKINGIMGQTNPVCPEAAPEGLSLYYGEIHSHTELSDGGGIPEENFRWARDVEGLDFAALADHFEDPFAYNYTLEEKWKITKEVTERFNQPGRFVTLLGYEMGTLEGHRNVYFADGTGRMIVEGPGGEEVTMDNVFAKLAGTDYILIPHAPKFHGINWHTPHDPERQRLVEICSCWGISEEGGPLSVRHALDLGYKFGFTGGTDNHFAEPGNPDLGGITGVYARSLARGEIFEALMSRRTFATTGQRMIITFWVNGTFMGGELALDPETKREVVGRAIACEPIEKIEVIRNGEVSYSISGKGGLDVSFRWDDGDDLSELVPQRELTDERFVYYYMRVETVDDSIGWSSPVWVHEKSR